MSIKCSHLCDNNWALVACQATITCAFYAPRSSALLSLYLGTSSATATYIFHQPSFTIQFMQWTASDEWRVTSQTAKGFSHCENGGNCHSNNEDNLHVLIDAEDFYIKILEKFKKEKYESTMWISIKADDKMHLWTCGEVMT